MNEELIPEIPEETVQLVKLVVHHLQEDRDEELSLLLEQVHEAEIATLLESLRLEYRRRVWPLIPVARQGEILPHLREDARASILDRMDQEEVLAVTEEMEAEDLADIMEDLPEDVGEAVLESLDEDRRRRLEITLSLAEDAAGRWMSPDVISVRKDVTLGVVLRYLRRLKVLPVHTDALMVTDDAGRYLGKLSLADVLTWPPETLVADVMNTEAERVHVYDHERDVAGLFEKRSFASLAVVDDQDKLLGRITVDDALEIVRDQADRAMLARGGLKEEEDLFAPVLSSAKSRAIWLGINLATVFLAAWVIGRFEAVLDKIVALAILMPVVASMGGIAGSQTLALTMRGLTLGQVGSSNLNWLVNKELAIGVINGLIWSLVIAAVTLLWFQDMEISMVIAAAIVVNLIAAAASGVFIPVILHRMGIDPAISGAVILTTVTDVVGFLSFLGLATMFLL
ncbi:MAG: magnesium transporter [Pseudomonadota bacterium]